MKTKEELKEYYKEYCKINKEELQTYRNTPKNKKRQKEYYQKNKEEIKAERDKPENKFKAKAYYENNKEKILEKAKEDYPKNKERMNKQSKEAHLKKNYNLSIEDYNKMVERQGGVCAICRKKEISIQNGKPQKLSVDHDWKTKKVRGLLCKNCNTTLGNLKEDISLFYKCVEYLKKHSN